MIDLMKKLISVLLVSFVGFVQISQAQAVECSALQDSDLVSALEANDCLLQGVLQQSIQTAPAVRFYGNGVEMGLSDYTSMPHGNGVYTAEIWMYGPNIELPARTRMKFKYLPYMAASIRTIDSDSLGSELQIYASNGFGSPYAATIGEFKQSLAGIIQLVIIPRQ